MQKSTARNWSFDTRKASLHSVLLVPSVSEGQAEPRVTILAAKNKQSSFLFKTYLNAMQQISFFFRHFKSLQLEQYLPVYSQESHLRLKKISGYL